jgi:hypothetical protein
MRSVVIELEYESDKPLLYVVERYLEGGQPFQKFNNNGEIALTRKENPQAREAMCFVAHFLQIASVYMGMPETCDGPEPTHCRLCAGTPRQGQHTQHVLALHVFCIDGEAATL